MCSETTAKYSYEGLSFCYKYEFAQYLRSLGMDYRDIAALVYPGKRFTDRVYRAIKQLVLYDYNTPKDPISVSRMPKKAASAIAGLTWSKVEYYSIMMGENTIKVSPEIFKRLKVTDGLLTIE